MTPQGLVIIVVFGIILIAAFIADNKKSKKIRADIDARFVNGHTADF
ncbi:MAG: hypothetical protein IJF03_08685 [Lachnospiraceae bacterium]|nr:hypothetical protein [Lachnospiraceae bacterium]